MAKTETKGKKRPAEAMSGAGKKDGKKGEKSKQGPSKKMKPNKNDEPMPMKKDLKKQRQASRPHYDTVVKAKELWNVIRERDTPKEKRKELVIQLMSLIRGKVYEIATKHDAARVIQGAIQFGTDKDREQILQELKDQLVEMCKLQYGHFVVQKLIRYCSSSQRDQIAKTLEGQVVRLATHNVAANILEFAQTWFKPATMARLRVEFYGREFALFRDDSKKSLAAILEAKPKKRDEVMKHVHGVLNRMIEKELLNLAFVQSLLWEYLSQATPAEVAAMVPSYVDGTLALVATRPGAKAAAHAVAYGSPKDRKKVLKALKGKVLEACNHPSGYLLLLRIFDVIDDTVNVQKSIISEMVPELFSVATDYNGRKALLQLLSPLNRRYLDPDELSVLHKPTISDPDDPTKEILTYKKDPEVRRMELLKSLQGPLEQLCASRTAELLCDRSGSDVLVETVKQWKTQAVIEAILSLVAQQEGDDARGDGQTDEEGGAEGSKVNVMEHPSGHFALKRLVQALPEFASSLLETLGDSLPKWAANNRGAFVVVALLEKEETKEKAKKLLQAHLKELKNHQEKKGTALILKALGEESVPPEQKVDAEREGNRTEGGDRGGKWTTTKKSKQKKRS